MKTTIISLVIFIALVTSSVVAQNSVSAGDDQQRIAISPVIPSELSSYPAQSTSVLKNKMRTIVGLNGMSAIEGTTIFVIYPQVAVIKNEVTATTPAMQAVRVEVIFNVADFYTGNVYASASHEVAGVGRTQDAAFTAAFQQLPERHGKYKVMMAKAKEEMLSYFNTHCDLAISRANSLAAQKRYNDALDLLNAVPPLARECFDKANRAAEVIARSMPVVVPVAEQKPVKQEDVVEIDHSGLVEIGHEVFIRLKSSRIVGDNTIVLLELISRNEDDFDQHFYRIYDTFIINEKGDELRIKTMTVAGKESNYYLKATLIPEVSTEMKCVFPKVKEVKMLRLMINDNYFRFKNIVPDR